MTDLSTLKGMRRLLGLTQPEAAEILGLSTAGIKDIEGGKGADRAAYRMALERYALHLAVKTGRIELAPPSVRREALELAKLITGAE